MSDPERARFEAWAQSPRRDMDLATFTEGPQTYVDDVTEWAWLSWQAAWQHLSAENAALRAVLADIISADDCMKDGMQGAGRMLTVTIDAARTITGATNERT